MPSEAWKELNYPSEGQPARESAGQSRETEAVGSRPVQPPCHNPLTDDEQIQFSGFGAGAIEQQIGELVINVGSIPTTTNGPSLRSDS